MLEQRYTTKMSSEKKTLQARFAKIRSKNGKGSRLAAGLIFGVLLLAVVTSTLILAVNRPEKSYAMSEAVLSDYLSKPIGTISAELDYADYEKVVFHYLKGFFVYEPRSGEIDLSIDLSKLDLAPHGQGDCVLQVTVDEEGKFAYLESIGDLKKINKFKKYIIDLETGAVTEDTMPEGTKVFGKRQQTFGTIPEPLGFYSDFCVITDDYDYYITTTEASVSALQLVAHNKIHDMTSYSYLFRHHYESPWTKQRKQVEKLIPQDERYPIGGDLHWETDGGVIQKLNERMDLDLNVPVDAAVNVAAYMTQKNDIVRVYLFFFDGVSQKLYDHLAYPIQLLPDVAAVLNNPKTDLYDKTYAMLYERFHELYSMNYNIQALTITNWQEKDGGEEARFYLNMSHIYYNRDPDKVEYIQDAKTGEPENYQRLYDDYLNIHQGNYFLKVVQENGTLALYVNQAPKGIEWVDFDLAFPG